MKRLGLLLLTLLLLAGCVQYDEELWINHNGSGRAVLRVIHRSPYENPEEIMRKATLPGINLQSYSIHRKGPDVIYTIRFKFKSIDAFNNVNDQLGAADFWGKITLNKEPGRRITFKRRIALGNQEPEEVDGIEDILGRLQPDNPIWTYKVHLPWKIISTNALSENVDYENRTVTWRFDTRKMWHKQELMTVELRKNFPWLLIVIGAIVLVLAFFLIHWMLHFPKKSHWLERLKHSENAEKSNAEDTEKVKENPPHN
ncbi:MAG: hypothetical protein ABFC98_04325 [Candidatus Cloacimonas sp.]